MDLSGVDENAQGERTIIPAGLYHGYIDTAEYKRSARSGQPMIECVIQVPDPQTGEERPLWFHLSFSEKAVSRTKRTLMRLDPEIDWTQFSGRQEAERLQGLRVRVRVRVKNNPPDHEYPGPQNQVRDIEPEPESFLQS